MYDEEIKLEQFRNYNAFCHGCLSTDRVLSSLGEYIDVYYKICDISQVLLPQETWFCWECMALLKNVKNFARKVENAQRILEYQTANKIIASLSSLSSLTTVTTDDIICVTHQEELESKLIPDILVKEEPDIPDTENYDAYDDFIEDSSKDYVYLEDLKNDQDFVDINVVKDWEKKRKRRSENYKWVYPEDRKKNLRKRVGIKCDELEFWMKNERYNEVYLSMEYKCAWCIYGWRNEESFKEHNIKYHNSTGRYECDICHVRFASKKKLTVHIINHYYVQQCTICDYKCYSKYYMRHHLSTHKKTVQCLHCDSCFHNIRVFFKHFRAMHQEFLCDHCGKRCKSKSTLVKHIRRHDAAHECKLCSKQFKTYETLRRHRRTKHASAPRDLSYCAPCDKQFTNVSLYRRHLHTSAAHARERNSRIKKEKVPCPECSNVYSRKVYMMNHYRHVHMKQSKHYCTDCDRYFLNRTRYVDHRRYQHDGVKKEKNKICNICGRGFNTNRILVNHIRTHSGERPFECEYCNAKFTQKSAMHSHVKYIHLKGKRRGCWQE